MYQLKVKLQSIPTLEDWDLVSGLLYQFHSLGIEEGEVLPQSPNTLVNANEFESALEPGVLNPPQVFIAYFDNKKDADRANRAITPTLSKLVVSFEISEVEEQDYISLYRDSFKPVRVPPNWMIRAPWHAEHALANELEIIIEPGMAFGTGSHETTQSCLELMSYAFNKFNKSEIKSVLDFGSGSGILSVGLKKLGVQSVYAVDIDPLAMDALSANSVLNRIEIKGSLTAKEFSNLDGIVANILKNTILDFAPSFKKWLKPGGFLIISGLLTEQENEIIGAYTTLGFKLDKKIIKSDWVSFLFVSEIA